MINEHDQLLTDFVLIYLLFGCQIFLDGLKNEVNK